MTPLQRWTIERLGHLLYTRARYDQATAIFEGLTQLAPEVHYPWYALGMIARKRGNDALAADYLKHAMQLAPKDPAVKLALAELEIRRGDRDSAASALRNIEQADESPDKARALVLRKRWFG